jgi:hypothetical protein
MSVSSSPHQPTPALHAGSSDTVDLRHHRGSPKLLRLHQINLSPPPRVHALELHQVELSMNSAL